LPRSKKLRICCAGLKLFWYGLNFWERRNEEKLWFVHVARKPILLRMERSVVAVRVNHPTPLQIFQRCKLQQLKPEDIVTPFEIGLAYQKGFQRKYLRTRRG
jgi:hypothetical protein